MYLFLCIWYNSEICLPLPPFYTLLAPFAAFKDVGIFCLFVFFCLFLNILHSVLVGELLANSNINSSTLHMGTGSLFKLLHACKCQPGCSVTDCWPSCG